MNAPRILLLVPYFGQWPFWMPFFLQSCRYNQDIDWLFFTDCGVPGNSPANVRYQETSFSEYCAQVTRRLGIVFAPSSPYKLCDLKPALGWVHEDRLSGYDFWGFSDIDLIYGQLRRHFDVVRLEQFDLLSTHERRISGHLCLIRNSPAMLELFKRVPNWEGMLADDAHLAFDEGAFSRLFTRFKNWPAPLRNILRTCNPLWRRSEFVEAYSTPYGRVEWHDGSFDFPGIWRWQKGHLTNDRDGAREFPYFHFIGWKGRDDWRTAAATNSLADPALPTSDCWLITSRGFLRCRS